MGKFAFHLRTVAAEHTSGCDFTGVEYIFVDYDKLRDVIKSSDPSAFRNAWRRELVKVSTNFDEHWKTGNGLILDAVLVGENYGPNNESMSARFDVALEKFAEKRGREAALDYLQDAKVMLQCASLNGEALLRSLRKFDKKVAEIAVSEGRDTPTTGMMRELLPDLFSSSFFLATSSVTLENNIDLLREKLEEDGGKLDSESDAPGSSAATAATSVEATRGDEFVWFQGKAKKLAQKELQALVAHRGFHCETDDSLSRPIENSLQSFEYAWGAGVHLCECDVVRRQETTDL